MNTIFPTRINSSNPLLHIETLRQLEQPIVNLVSLLSFEDFFYEYKTFNTKLRPVFFEDNNLIQETDKFCVFRLQMCPILLFWVCALPHASWSPGSNNMVHRLGSTVFCSIHCHQIKSEPSATSPSETELLSSPADLQPHANARFDDGCHIILA
jgi:hypothetical protein